MNKIINDKEHQYHLNNLYYALDGQNIFKRVDRYWHKLFLIIIFSFLILVNFHEILFNAIHFCSEIGPDYPNIDPNKNDFFKWNLLSEFLCDFFILALIILSFYTFGKFGIDTKIYFW